MKRLSKDQKQQRADLVTRLNDAAEAVRAALAAVDNSPAPSRLVNADALGEGAQVLPTAPAAEVSAARPGTTFRNAHPRSVPGHTRVIWRCRLTKPISFLPAAGR
jgi:hypothetical protein